ncbi:hypothetical protein [Flagellimonas abyssi]|uniref:Uncharacterized protein n=1 Tax=Flagellimonas abyssi TaxID=2864871 RepID=A0ABS7EPX7_9FLAO|nr:hypothetical protein [Allomuricauda abyssi]MBW8199625.1 hypothetical protein [Allomuricauda abyssi]
MRNFIWNRDPQEAMDNPYEYEAQKQFRKEAKKLIRGLRSYIITEYNFKLTEKSTEKAVWMLTMNALDSALEIVRSLNKQNHRVTAHLLRTIDESIDLAEFFNSESIEAKNKLDRWFNDEIISHSDFRDYIKKTRGEETSQLHRDYYRTISKFSHNSYKTLLYSYVQLGDESIIHESKYDSGILIPVQTISMYHAISGAYFQKIAFKMAEFNLIDTIKMLEMMSDSQDVKTEKRRFESRKK